MDFKLEICVDSVYSALVAEEAGASRVELCDNLTEGGTTPSYATIESARKNITIGLNVLIRPRGGDFLYTDNELEIMSRDIEICRDLGADGVVLGILLPDGTPDIKRTSALVRLAHPMPVTFHRSFDMCPEPVNALEGVIQTGAARILTSGQRNTAAEGALILRDLVRRGENRIIIMPGSGISDTNIEEIARLTGAAEFHLSARKVLESKMVFRKEGVSMGNAAGYNEFIRKVADGTKIKNIIRLLEGL